MAEDPYKHLIIAHFFLRNYISLHLKWKNWKNVILLTNWIKNKTLDQLGLILTYSRIELHWCSVAAYLHYNDIFPCHNPALSHSRKPRLLAKGYIKSFLFTFHFPSFELSVDIFDYMDTLVDLEKRSKFTVSTIFCRCCLIFSEVHVMTAKS